MHKYHWEIILNQVGLMIIGSKTPAYGIPPFLWDTKPNGDILHWQTLLNYIQWIKDMK